MNKTTRALIAVSVFLMPMLDAAISDADAAPIISAFLTDPLSQASQDAARQINQFCEESPDHEVVIDAKYMPWLGSSKPPEKSEILLVAFMAGNLKAQIEKKTSKPEPYAGALAVIDVYNKIRANTMGYRVSSIDQWISLEKQGRLETFIGK
jgi:hypothetical protein